ncbi:probable methyltransferase PMT27 [Carica papaya]|uniref:probable methyltransferase PMT27 n=1 Tax=Carica papaya TaxID=3649 RepID=UPI000B8CA14C|nr:probable methyltransferase PMT27 [Carica papaya]
MDSNLEKFFLSFPSSLVYWFSLHLPPQTQLNSLLVFIFLFPPFPSFYLLLSCIFFFLNFSIPIFPSPTLCSKNMAIGRSRSSKRTSSGSHTSTVTTVVFVALCVLGVWMLTSNSVVPPQTTDRAAKSTAGGGDANGNVDFLDTSNTEPITKQNNVVEESSSKERESKDQPAFEDNPGHLPDDAIKSDEPGKEKTNNKEQEVISGVDQDNTQQGADDDQEKERIRQIETQINEIAMSQNQQEEQNNQQTTDSGETDNNNNNNNNNNDNNNDNKQQSTGSEEGDDNGDQDGKSGKGTESSQESQTQKSNENPTENTETLKEFETEQREQREEDSGDQKSTQENQNGGSNQDSKKQEEQKQQQQEQKQTGNDPEVTFNDATKQQQPPESGFFNEVTGTDASHPQQTQKTTEQKQDTDQQNKSESTQQPKQASTASNTGSFPGAGNSGIPKESAESKKSWKTQAAQSKNEKARQIDESTENVNGYTWRLCNVTAGPDYIPCLDNVKALRLLKTTGHFEHRERHCPEDPPTCLVPLPEGYKWSIQWPKSRDKIWYHNVPHTKLAEVKGHQNWVKVTGEFLTFPGGGTQFIHGALHYIDYIQQSVPAIKWGKHTRSILDVGCGVASFGGYLFERNVLTMSFAPKDEHEAQVQFALERGIPAISAVMGSKRLPFPARVFDLLHCARCRVPWHNEGGLLLLELNRVLRPGGYFVWSATPVYQQLEEDVEIWKAMSALTKSMCWELVTITKDKLNGIGAAIYRKPTTNDCYDKREQNQPPMCKNDDDPNAAWYVPLQACMHRVPTNPTERGTKWPEEWPHRLETPPYWVNSSQMGIYGKPAPQDFLADYEHWKQVVTKVYMNELGISWSNVRNIMDMRAVYGGFAAALKDLPVWVLNVVNINAPDTLPIIYERGLFGIYHDWCESFSTYPRSYDLLHADHLFSTLKTRCQLVPVIAEVDRIVRPGGKLIVRDESNTIREVENLLKSLFWEVHLTFSKNQEGILSAQKGNWRPDTYEVSS